MYSYHRHKSPKRAMCKQSGFLSLQVPPGPEELHYCSRTWECMHS